MTAFKIKDIQPNPFRHIDRYPINQEKVAALRESIHTTDFWNNILARTINGKPEIAYGHHRLAALKQEFDPEHEVDLTVRDLSDGDMLRIMARENMEAWAHDASVENATVGAVVQAYAAGRIKLRKPGASARKGMLRNAPSFIRGEGGAESAPRPYTADSIAEFLGWQKKRGKDRGGQFSASERVSRALCALELIERGTLSENDFEGLSGLQAQDVIRKTTAAESRHQLDPHGKRKATEVGRAVAEELKHGWAGSRKLNVYDQRKIQDHIERVPEVKQRVISLGLGAEEMTLLAELSEQQPIRPCSDKTETGLKGWVILDALDIFEANDTGRVTIKTAVAKVRKNISEEGKKLLEEWQKQYAEEIERQFREREPFEYFAEFLVELVHYDERLKVIQRHIENCGLKKLQAEINKRLAGDESEEAAERPAQAAAETVDAPASAVGAREGS